MNGLAVDFDAIEKAFGPVQVLHGVSFSLAPGRVYGLLGENGAGKSTLMKILAGYEQPSAGTLRINGAARQFAQPNWTDGDANQPLDLVPQSSQEPPHFAVATFVEHHLQ